jgi:hypothetical protein
LKLLEVENIKRGIVLFILWNDSDESRGEGRIRIPNGRERL